MSYRVKKRVIKKKALYEQNIDVKIKFWYYFPPMGV